MKILSWNIYNFFEASYFVQPGMFDVSTDAEEYVQKRLTFFTHEIQKHAPDVVYLMEVGSEALLRQLAVGVFGEDVFVFKTQGDRRGIFNACIARQPLACEEVFVDHLEIPLFVVGEPSVTDRFLKQKRGFIQTKIGNTFIYAVHLKAQLPSNLKTANGDDYEPQNAVEVARAHVVGELTGLAEAYALRKIFSEHIMSGAHVMVLGDYNTPTSSRRMSVLRGGTYTKELADELMDVFPIDDPAQYSYIWKNQTQRIDHILLDRKLLEKIQEKKMLSEYVNAQSVNAHHDVGIIGSDHAPVYIEIDLEN